MRHVQLASTGFVYAVHFWTTHTSCLRFVLWRSIVVFVVPNRHSYPQPTSALTGGVWRYCQYTHSVYCIISICTHKHYSWILNVLVSGFWNNWCHDVTTGAHGHARATSCARNSLKGQSLHSHSDFEQSKLSLRLGPKMIPVWKSLFVIVIPSGKTCQEVAAVEGARVHWRGVAQPWGRVFMGSGYIWSSHVPRS